MIQYLIFGKGFLGNRFQEILEDCEISDHYLLNYDDLLKELKSKKPKVVINCIGKTGIPNVDWCEEHKLETLFSNVTCPLLLLRATQELGIYFVHLSSGCIYQGDNDGKGYSEEDEPNFYGSYYARTKIMAEKILKEFDALQLRLRMPIDYKPHQRNIITKLSSYKKIISIENSYTVLDDAVFAAKKLMDKKKHGIYNIVNPGTITNEEIIRLYKKMVDSKHEYSIVPVIELKNLVKSGRSNCVLNTDKLRKEGILLKPINEKVVDVLKKYKEA